MSVALQMRIGNHYDIVPSISKFVDDFLLAIVCHSDIVMLSSAHML